MFDIRFRGFRILCDTKIAVLIVTGFIFFSFLKLKLLTIKTNFFNINEKIFDNIITENPNYGCSKQEKRRTESNQEADIRG
jgi:hypothetical protein